MHASLRNLTALALASLLVLTGFAPAAHADEQTTEEPTLSTVEDQAEDLAEESQPGTDVSTPIAVDRILSGGGPTRILDGDVFYTNVRLYLADPEGIEDLPLPDAPIEIYDTNDVNRENLLGSSDDWFLETGAGTPHFRIDNFDMDVALPPGDYRFDFVFSGSGYYEDAERTQGGGYWRVLDPAELTQLNIQAEAADSIFEDENLDVHVEVTPDMDSNWRGNFTSTEAGIYFADDAEFENPLATHRPVTGRWDQPWEGTLEVAAEDLPLGQHELIVRTHQYAQITVAPAVSEPFTVQVLPPEPEHPAWDSSAVYTGGEIVEYQGQVFEALWWTQNQEPGASPYSAWSEIGAPTECESGTYPAWAASTEFRGGETVVHEGTVYTAKWYSRNQEPGDQWGPWEDSGDC